MTKAQLNRDVKNLFKNFEKIKSQDNYYEQVEILKKEYQRLYNADNKFEYLTRDNILRMMVLNRKHRVIQFHQFGIFIEDEKLM